MTMTILLIVQVLLAIALIALILVQRGRGADTGAAFGSGSSTTVFGARGSASFLSRSTSILAICFFSNCFVLSYFAGRTVQPKSVMEQAAGSGTALEEALKKAVDDASKAAASKSEVPAVPAAPATGGDTSEVPTIKTEAAPEQAAAAPAPAASAPTETASSPTSPAPAAPTAPAN